MIADRYAPKWFASYYRRLGINVFILLIVLSFGGDIYHIFYPI
jgi:hypothetical protein